MAFPRKLLVPGEEIVVEAHPNWSVLVRPVVIALVLIGGCIAGVLVWSSAPSVVDDVLAAIAALVVLWLGVEVIAYRSRLLVITTTRVVYRWGVIRRTGREIPLDRVQDVTYHQSLLERVVGAGSLTVESAGAHGEEPFPDVRNPAGLQSLINQLIVGDRGSWRGPLAASPTGGGLSGSPMPAPPASPAPPSSVPTATYGVPGDPPTDPFPPATAPAAGQAPLGGALAEQLRDLERLHEAGVLTDDEFDAKRRHLLGM